MFRTLWYYLTNKSVDGISRNIQINSTTLAATLTNEREWIMRIEIPPETSKNDFFKIFQVLRKYLLQKYGFVDFVGYTEPRVQVFSVNEHDRNYMIVSTTHPNCTTELEKVVTLFLVQYKVNLRIHKVRRFTIS